MLIIIQMIFAVVIYYICSFFKGNYWHKRAVNCARIIPILGSFPNILMRNQHFADDINDVYNNFKILEDYVGVFIMRMPQLMILNPKLVREVFVTSFQHFEDNDIAKMVDKNKDPLIANNPFVLTGDEWREQRSLVTPGLTGSRIRVAYEIMQKICHDFCIYIEQQNLLAAGKGVNGKDLALRFTAESVCDSVLGIKANSFSAQPLPISENVKKFAEENKAFIVYTIFAGIYPGIINFYRAKFFPLDCEMFFLKLMKQAFELRSQSNVERHDFMQHLLTLKEKDGTTELHLASHAMTFLIDGLDTTATTISHCLLLLARDEQKQTVLREEIISNSDENGQLSFEKLNELRYLDACIHETLRIFPAGVWASKICTTPYEFENKYGEKLKLNVGESVMIPIYALHHDSKYYDSPDKFMPERFLTETESVKTYMDKGVYLGFGNGPRMCFGMRFALVQAKAAISCVIKQFNVKLNPRTKSENRLDPKIFLTSQIGGVWLDFEKIN